MGFENKIEIEKNDTFVMKVIIEPDLRHPVIEYGAEQLLVQKGVQSVESGQHQSGFTSPSVFCQRHHCCHICHQHCPAPISCITKRQHALHGHKIAAPDRQVASC